MEYMLVSGKKSTVEETVNKMIQDWWRPCGGISITNNSLSPDKYFYSQAMIKNSTGKTDEVFSSETYSKKPSNKIRVCTRHGYGGREGVALGPNIVVGGTWTPVLWDDNDKPEFFRTDRRVFLPTNSKGIQ